MTVSELKPGDKLHSISNASWLIKDAEYTIVSFDERYVKLGNGLFWPIQTIHEHFTLVLKPLTA